MCHYIREYLVPLLPYEFCSSYTLLVRQCCSLLQPRRPVRTILQLVGTRNPLKCNLNNLGNHKCYMPKTVSRLKGVFLEIYFFKNWLGDKSQPFPYNMLRRDCIQQEEKANAAPANDWTTSMHKLARTPHWGICQEKLTEHPHKTFVTAATAAIYSSLASYIYTTLKVGP